MLIKCCRKARHGGEDQEEGGRCGPGSLRYWLGSVGRGEGEVVTVGLEAFAVILGVVAVILGVGAVILEAIFEFFLRTL